MNPWKKEEKDKLKQLLEKYPCDKKIIYEKYRDWAIANGKTKRSYIAVKKRILKTTPKRQVHKWTVEEKEYLATLAGGHPTPNIFWLYRSWAARSNYPSRNDYAIVKAASRYGISLKTGDGVFNLKQLSETLDIPLSTAYSWHRKGLLKGTRRSSPSSSVYVNQNQIKEFAKSNPRCLRTVEIDRLKYFIDDDDVLKAIKQSKPIRYKKIIDKETGKEYPSKAAFARALNYACSSTTALENRCICITD